MLKVQNRIIYFEYKLTCFDFILNNKKNIYIFIGILKILLFDKKKLP
jgi:hypothetical protein